MTAVQTGPSVGVCINAESCSRKFYGFGCRGPGCVAANAAYMADWRRTSKTQIKRRHGIGAATDSDVPRGRPGAIDTGALQAVPLGVYVATELAMSASEGFTPEYVRWLKRTAKKGRVA